MDLPVDSIRDATFTESPKIVNFGIDAPTTPDTIGPLDEPALIKTRIPLYRNFFNKDKCIERKVSRFHGCFFVGTILPASNNYICVSNNLDFVYFVL
mmetsp:Transcript_17657/g.26804  ORF Transcript_17657/g.26804 Transcript_17657/m.26804 type:complete len:97 (-) Transcript_17657:265-555(-)